MKSAPDNLPQKPGVYLYKKGRAILYVGKASVLKDRISSYFRQSASLSPAKHRLLGEATSLIWEETDSEIEALLLEAHYIKKFRPPYNVLLRDDKTFLSVVITAEPFPRILPTRKIGTDGEYFGPFTDARAVKETLRVLRKFFPYRTSCVPNNGRACLDSHLGLCPGVCVGRISETEYKKTVRRITLFFEGKKRVVVSALKRERTAWLKKADDNSERRLARIDQQLRWLEKVMVMTHVLQHGEKMAGDVVELGKVLALSKPPHRIEGYDISHVSGTLTTASMVVFTDGIADKAEYKKFKIKTVRGANDVASLREVFNRRFAHLPGGEKEPWPLPDLVVVDGGRPQLGVAMEVWRDMNLSVPLISLAKRYEEIFIAGQVNALVLPRSSPALHLVQRVRDEAHRFCKNYHKLLRQKKLLQ